MLDRKEMICTSEPKRKVWMVDDLEIMRTAFEKSHKDHYDLRIFKNIDEVMEALRSGASPDALVCDIYFFPSKNDLSYDSNHDAEMIEKEVSKRAEQLARFAQIVDASGHALGITLAHEVNNFFKGKPPFPIFAYSYKAGLLMDNEGF
jgi:hypothetical protein